jgi:hypothetical protein
MGEWRDEDGNHLAFTTWKGADGSMDTVTHNVDPWSSSFAKEYFDKQVGKANKVLKRGKQVDKHGKTLGERAVVVILSGEHGKPVRTPALLFTVGSYFFGYTLNSLAAILEMEKWQRRRD